MLTRGGRYYIWECFEVKLKGKRRQTPIQTFSLVGVTKCGTSSLYAYLAQHPQICLSQPKEPWCFEEPHVYENFRKGGFAEYYRRYFPHYAGQPAVGDCNARKLTFPWALRMLHEQMPEARILVLVRNPVQRAFSEWWMDFFAGSETLDFPAALEENLKCIEAGRVLHDDENVALQILPDWFESRRLRQPMPTRNYLGSGYYWKGVERAQQLFSKERVKVVVLEDLRDRPEEVLREIFVHLGVDPDIPVTGTARHNEAFGELARLSVEAVRRTGLPRLLPVEVRERLMRLTGKTLLRVGDRGPVLEPEVRAWLHEHYADHNRRLSCLTQVDLRAWQTQPRGATSNAIWLPRPGES